MNDWNKTKGNLNELYSSLIKTYGDKPEAIQMSQEGQLFRFKKLCEIGDLNNSSILDIGCGLGDFYDYLLGQYENIDYTGIDIVYKLIEICKNKYPNANFMCKDLFQEDLEHEYDYIFISMVFNNIEMKKSEYFQEMLKIAYSKCKIGIGFNFTSDYKNFQSKNSVSYDPADMLTFCLNNLSYKTNLYHHYERCDVSVFIYK